MNKAVEIRDIIGVLASFYETHESDDDISELILDIGSEILNVSSDKMFELIKEVDE